MKFLFSEHHDLSPSCKILQGFTQKLHIFETLMLNAVALILNYIYFTVAVTSYIEVEGFIFEMQDHKINWLVGV